MVKDHSERKRGNLLPPHGLLFLISSNGSFICTIPQDSTTFVTPVVEHWLEREREREMEGEIVRKNPDGETEKEGEREK